MTMTAENPVASSSGTPLLDSANFHSLSSIQKGNTVCISEGTFTMVISRSGIPNSTPTLKLTP